MDHRHFLLVPGNASCAPQARRRRRRIIKCGVNSSSFSASLGEGSRSNRQNGEAQYSKQTKMLRAPLPIQKCGSRRRQLPLFHDNYPNCAPQGASQGAPQEVSPLVCENMVCRASKYENERHGVPMWGMHSATDKSPVSEVSVSNGLVRVVLDSLQRAVIGVMLMGSIWLRAEGSTQSPRVRVLGVGGGHITRTQRGI